MALTPQFTTGFEHGLVSVSGAGLLNTIVSTPTIVGAAARNGNYGLRITAPVNTAISGRKNFTASAKIQTRFAMRVNTLPTTAGSVSVFAFTGVAGGSGAFSFRVFDTGVTRITIGASNVDGPTIVAGDWHVYEFQSDTSGAATQTCDWWVDGVQQTQISLTVASAGTYSVAFFGTAATTQAAYEADFDDWILGNWTATTDQWGDGKVLAQLPGSDGTHATVTAFSPGDAGTAYSGTVTTANTMVDDAPPWVTARSTTDNLAQRIANTAAYLEIAPAATSETATANAVSALLSYSSSTTTANNAGCIVRNGAGAGVVLWGDLPVAQGGGGGALADYSESTNFFKSVLATTPAGGWTPTAVNAVRWRFGGSSDISPVPTAQALMLEVDWPVSTVTPVNISPTAAGASSAADLVTAPSLLSVLASAVSAANDVVAWPVRIAPTASGIGLATSAATAPTALSPTASGVSAASDFVTALVQLTPVASGIGAAADLVTAKVLLAPTSQGISSAADLVTVPMPVAPQAVGAGLATMLATIQASLTPSAAAASTATDFVTAATRLSPAASGIAAATAPVMTQVLIVPTSQGVSTATDLVTAPVTIVPQASGIGLATMLATAQLALSPTAASASAASDFVTALVKLAPVASGVSAAAAPATAQVLLAPTSQGIAAATNQVTAMVALALSAAGATQATNTVQAPGIVFFTPSASGIAAATGLVTATTKLSPAALAASAASLLVTARMLMAPSSAAVAAASSPVTAASLLVPSAQSVAATSSLITALASLSPSAAGISSASLGYTAASLLSLSASGVSSAADKVTAATRLSPSALAVAQALNIVSNGGALLTPTAAAASAAASPVTAIAVLVPTAAGVSAAVMTYTVAQRLSAQALGQSAAADAVTAPTNLVLLSASGSEADFALFTAISLHLNAIAATGTTGNVTFGNLRNMLAAVASQARAWVTVPPFTPGIPIVVQITTDGAAIEPKTGVSLIEPKHSGREAAVSSGILVVEPKTGAS